MLKNYFKVAYRNIIRNKAFSFINIAGLSIGLACCMLIVLYAEDELSFDRFQQNKNELFRITCEVVDKSNGSDTKYGEAAAVQGPVFKKEVPEVKGFVRTYEQDFVTRNAGENFDEKGTWVDDNFFKIFSFPLVYGEKEKVLSDQHSVVLTEDMAKKYFGKTNALGKTLEIKINNAFEPFVVTGIAKSSPENSSVRFNMLLNFSYYTALSQMDHGYWHMLNYSTYLVLHKRADVSAVCAKMNEAYKKYAADQVAELSKQGFDTKFIWGLQPFLQMHLDTQVTNEGSIKDESNPIYSYILTGIAVFILLVACINFTNLTVAQSLKRSKEIGLRKVIGGSRKELMLQFLGESFVVCFIAFVLAIVLAFVALPLFSELANKRLSLGYLFNLPLVASFIGLFLLTGFAAGFYPALVLSKFQPVETLQGRTRVTGNSYLSKGLVVVQFALATFMIIATMFIYFQYEYLTHTNLGYNDKNLLAVNAAGQGKNKQLLHLFKTQLASLPSVQQVGERMAGHWGTDANVGARDIGIDLERVDEAYLPTLGVQLVSGRNFSSDFPSDSTHAVIVNESFVKEAGWKSAIGKTVDQVDGKDCKCAVTGVIKDYHSASLKQKIKPQLFTMNPKLELGQFVMRLQPVDKANTLKAIEKIYRQVFPFNPFQYYFVDEHNAKNYEQESNWKQIIMYASMLTVFLSCMGLFGLGMLSIRNRTKEIGIRKVIGASVWQIAALVTTNFIKLVLLAFLPAIPAAWFAASRWLENFPYRITMNGFVFCTAAILILLIALFTVGFQAIWAAKANPVKSLRAQ